MSNEPIPTERPQPDSSVRGYDLPDWADTADDERPDSEDTWRDDAVADLGTPPVEHDGPSGTEDSEGHLYQLSVCRVECSYCETTTLRRHHEGCDAPIVRLGGEWQCGACGIEIPPPRHCHDCGGPVTRTATAVPVDLCLEARPAAIERAVHAETNHRRANHGLAPLAYSDHLQAIALQHSRDMAQRDFFDHATPDGDEAVDRYRQFGHDERSCGENLARVYPDRAASPEAAAREVVGEWMDSPGHRENLLEERFEREGIGIYLGDGGAIYATQNFY